MIRRTLDRTSGANADFSILPQTIRFCDEDATFKSTSGPVRDVSTDIKYTLQVYSETIVDQHEVPPCHSERCCPPGVGPRARSSENRRTGDRRLRPEPIGHCVLHDVLGMRFACVRYHCVRLHGGHQPAGIRLGARTRCRRCLRSLLCIDWGGGSVLACLHRSI